MAVIELKLYCIGCNEYRVGFSGTKGKEIISCNNCRQLHCDVNLHLKEGYDDIYILSKQTGKIFYIEDIDIDLCAKNILNIFHDYGYLDAELLDKCQLVDEILSIENNGILEADYDNRLKFNNLLSWRTSLEISNIKVEINEMKFQLEEVKNTLNEILNIYKLAKES